MSQTIHSAAFPVELWILDDEDYSKAVALWEEWRNPLSEARQEDPSSDSR